MANIGSSASLSEELGDIIEEYAQWYNRIIRDIFYTDGASNEKAQGYALANFENWLSKAQKVDSFDGALLDRLSKIHNEIKSFSETLLKNTQSSEKPDVEAYDEFSHMFADFTGRVQRLGRDSKLSDGGIDPLTGMRSMSVFEQDIAREIERRLRSKNPFCLLAVRLDNLKTLLSDGEAFKNLQPLVAEEIKKCLRTYDDAYRQEDGIYVLCLKNTVFSGACAAITRINKALAKNVHLPDGSAASVSCSVMSDQFEAKNILEITEGLHKDVAGNADEYASILQYKEMSALQKYVVNIKD